MAKDIVSGIYGIINENTNGIITNNTIDFGQAAILTLGGSNIIANDNTYLLKKIQCNHIIENLSATISINDELYTIPFTINDFIFPITLEKQKNSIYKFKAHEFTYTYQQKQQNYDLPIDLTEKLTGQTYNLQFSIYLSGYIPSTEFLPETILPESLDVNTYFFGKLYNADNKEENYRFDSIIKTVSGSTTYDLCSSIINDIPASGDTRNLTSSGILNLPATGSIQFNGTFEYKDEFNKLHTVTGSNIITLIGPLISSSTTGLLNSDIPITSVVTGYFNCQPEELSILYPGYEYVEGTCSIIETQPISSYSIETGTFYGDFNVTGMITKNSQIDIIRSANGQLISSNILRDINPDNVVTLDGTIKNAETDREYKYVNVQTMSSQYVQCIGSSIVSSTVSYIMGLLSVSAETTVPFLTNTNNGVVLFGNIQQEKYKIPLNLNTLMSSNTQIVYTDNTDKNVIGFISDDTISSYINLVKLDKYPNFDINYLTTKLMINAEASQSYNNDTDIIPYISANIIENISGGISNFPDINENTGTLCKLIDLSNLSEDIQSEISGFSQSYVGLSQTLIHNGQKFQWSRKTNEYYDFISYVSNYDLELSEERKASRDLYFVFSNKIYEKIINTSKFTKTISNNCEQISEFIKETLTNIQTVINKLPKNFYNRDIHIVFNMLSQVDDINSIEIKLDKALKISNLYNCNIYIQNISDAVKVKLSSNEHTILNLINLNQVYLKNVQFVSCYEKSQDMVNAPKYMQLISALNINYFKCINCIFDNIVPRIINPSLFNNQQTLLAYPTYALLYINNTKLQLNSSTLTNSNHGVIAYCNSDVQYTGETYINFNAILYYFDDRIPNSPISGQFLQLSGDVFPVLSSDFDKISSSIIDYTETGTYMVLPSILNYIAGNSRGNLYVDANNKLFKNGIEVTAEQCILLLMNQQNFNLGICQLGSIFNHTHNGLTLDTTHDLKERLDTALNMIKTIATDPCVGMSNPQLPINLFETNNQNNSIGYTYTSISGVHNVYGEHNYQQKLLTQNFPLSTYNIVSMNYNKLSSFIMKQDEYTNNANMCLSSDMYTAINAGLYAKNIIDKTDKNLYNNGQFWFDRILDKNILPNYFIVNNDNVYNNLIYNDVSQSTTVQTTVRNIFIEPSAIITNTSGIYIDIISAFNLDAETNYILLSESVASGLNIPPSSFNKSPKIPSTISLNNQGMDGLYFSANTGNQLVGSYFTSENITNIRYACLIKNYFSADSNIQDWVSPAIYTVDNSLSGLTNFSNISDVKDSVGLLTKIKQYQIPFRQKIIHLDLNISDRYNSAIRKQFSVATGFRYDNFAGAGVVQFRQNAGSNGNIARQNQICFGNPIFYQESSNDVQDFKDFDTNNTEIMLTNNYPNVSIIPTVRSKYDLNLPFPRTVNKEYSIDSNPLNYEAIDMPFKFYNETENTKMYDNLISSNTVLSTQTALYQNNIEYNSIEFKNDYYGFTNEFKMFTKTSKLTNIPSFCNGKVSTSIFLQLSGNSEELVNQYETISGKYNLPEITDINNFNQ